MPSYGAARGEPEEFTSARAHQVMVGACDAVGLASDGARLIRLGENALFRLERHPVIVRIVRSAEYLDDARREVRVSRWLEAEGFPAARVVEDVEQAVVVSGHPVTFWHLIEESDRKAAYGELGGILRDLHALWPPAGLDLPPYDVFGRSDLRVEQAAGIRRMTANSCASAVGSCAIGSRRPGSTRPRARSTGTPTYRTSWSTVVTRLS